MLSDSQKRAWDKLTIWIKKNDPDEPFFILGGVAGSGKSYLLGYLAKAGYENLYFSATTNKAAKVVGEQVGFVAKTIYSLLGLRMEQYEDKLVLTTIPEKAPYFPKGSIIVIDEASMIGKALLEIIEDTTLRARVRVIFVGDPAQLPPVGELSSPVWTCTKNPDCGIVMTEVMRNDNELLALATELRGCIKNKTYESPIEHSVAEDGSGIYLWPSKRKLERYILDNVHNINFHEEKIIAWRNVTVNYYNNLVRSALGHTEPYEETEIILLARPIERNGELVAHTDDEFVIDKRTEGVVMVDMLGVDVWCLEVSGFQKFILKVPKDPRELEGILNAKSAYASSLKGKKRYDAWKDFWKTKNAFDEIRYGYALTAHRAQGSTLKKCFVDQQDILLNHKSREAFQCLYVAITRPTEAVHTF